jgi:hypothetical protein
MEPGVYGEHGVLSANCGRSWVFPVLWFFPGAAVSSTNKTDHHDIAEILLKVALNTITPTPSFVS